MINQDRSYRKIAAGLAESLTVISKPKSAHAHIIPGKKPLLFIPNGSRLLHVSKEINDRIAFLHKEVDEQSLLFHLISMGLDVNPIINDQPLQNPPLHAISLSIAQKCNMGCTYCYAAQGEFGEAARQMPLEIALKAVDLLLSDKKRGDKIQVTFLGGEPLMARKELKMAVAYAADAAAKKNVDIGFSITTNGTLLRKEDAQFFEEYSFAVTVSLDGSQREHDVLRPLKNGKGSFLLIKENVQSLLDIQRNMQVSARVTVTPQNLNIADTLDEFINMGFHSVGFSPLLRSINGKNEMDQNDLNQMLAGMIECGLKFEEAILLGKRYPFLNMMNAFKEISKSTHRPYPCGAGAGYLGVSADGQLAACHRFVNDNNGNMGSVEGGIDPYLQNKWLNDRHVHNQQPCSDCWARYLCGGGCHHEVIEKGRTACDYIRSWLHFTIQSFERVNHLVPDWNI